MNYFLMPGLPVNKSLQSTIELRTRIYDSIFKKVCDVYELEPKYVLARNKTRLRDIVEIRQISLTLFKHKVASGSLKEKGAYFKKDHATVLHSIKTVKNLRETDRVFREKTAELFKNITFDE